MPSSSTGSTGGVGDLPPIADHARMLETLLSNLPGMVYRCRNDADWTMLFVSEGSRELTGHAPADFCANRRVTFGDLIVVEDRPRVWEVVQAALAKRARFELRYRITTAAGARKWVWERGRGIFGADDQLEHIEGFICDVTAAACAEQELQVSESRLALVFNASRDMMCLIKVEPGPAFRVVSVNDEYVRAVQRASFKWSAAEMAGRPFDDWKTLFNYSDEVWRLLMIRYRRAIETRQPLHYEELTETPTGVYYGDTWLTPMSSPETGEIEFVLYTSTDITDRVRAERALAENQRTLSAILDNSFQFIGLLDTEGRLLRANQTALAVIKARLEEVQGRFFWDTAWWSHSTAEQARLRDAVARAARGEFVRFETSHPAVDGRRLLVDFSLTPVRDEDGRVISLIPEGRDITEHKQTEEALRNSEEKFSKAFRASPDAFSLSDLDTSQFLAVNEGFVRIFGFAQEEVIGRTARELGFWVVPADREKMLAAVNATGSVRNLLTTFRTRHDGDRLFLVSGERVEISGRPCLVIVSHDITEQKIAERALRELEEKFSKAFRASPDAISVSDLETGEILDVNEGFERAIGFTRAEIVGRTSNELQLWTDPEDRARIAAELRARGSVRNLPVNARMRDGEARCFLLSAERVEIGGRPRLVIISRDISEQKLAEQALRESEEKFAKAFLSSPTSLTITELPSGRYIDVNTGFERTTGYTRAEVIGRTALEIGIWADVAHRDAFIRELQEKRAVRDMECTFVSRTGQLIIARCSADLIEVGGKTCALTVIEDITEQRRAEQARAALEQQLRQAQKLEALGQLAGGIAHDFNNILTGILAYAELTVLDAERPDEVRRHIGAVKLASERAGDLVRQILTFSRRRAPERKSARLATVIEEALKLLRSTLPSTIEIVAEIDPAAPLVLADATQIHQVVMNLCTNAAQAMKLRSGRLTIRLAPFDTLAVNEGMAPPGLESGRHARLTISDTGSGMDAATLSHIFEPFFTTKAPGEGTGLGLAVVHGIVEEHDGVITVRSEVGIGTTFDLYLPEFSGLEDDAVDDDGPLPRGQGQHILFVDDETAIVRAVAQLLVRLGYRATVHSDPLEAWEVFDADPAAFDLVITDLTMPQWTGVELSRRLLARRPDLPIVLTTGHSGTWTPLGIKALGIRTMIAKPLTSAKLAIELHAIFGAGGKPGAHS